MHRTCAEGASFSGCRCHEGNCRGDGRVSHLQHLAPKDVGQAGQQAGLGSCRVRLALSRQVPAAPAGWAWQPGPYLVPFQASEPTWAQAAPLTHRTVRYHKVNQAESIALGPLCVANVARRHAGDKCLLAVSSRDLTIVRTSYAPASCKTLTKQAGAREYGKVVHA